MRPLVNPCWRIPVAFQEAYTVACIELFRRLWVELERVPVAEDTSHPESASVTCRSREEIIRLELVLLLDACRSERWRMQLDTSERCLLDAVLGHCAADPSIAARRGAGRVSSKNSRSVVRDHH
jgi:hypothetical protein